MATRDNLNPQQFSWEQVSGMHEDYADAEDLVNWAAHATAADPEAEHTSPDDLTFRHRMVDVGYNTNLRYHKAPIDRQNPRVYQARQGYNEGADVPPVLGVQRGRKIYWADGNHRVEAARTSRESYANYGHYKIPAYIARSPETGDIPKDLFK